MAAVAVGAVLDLPLVHHYMSLHVVARMRAPTRNRRQGEPGLNCRGRQKKVELRTSDRLFRRPHCSWALYIAHLRRCDLTGSAPRVAAGDVVGWRSLWLRLSMLIQEA